MSKEIAKTILNQLGNNKFIAMTGAKNLVVLEKGLGFRLPRFAGLKINYVEIKVNAMDLYNVTFKQIKRNFDVVTLKEQKDIFCENLKEVLTQETGLYTSL